MTKPATMPRLWFRTDAEYALHVATHASLYATDAGIREEIARDLPAMREAARGR